jgi:hypothetical protein
VIRFMKRGTLCPRFIGPFVITVRIDRVAYRLELPDELSGVHNVFHVSNLRKCIVEEARHVPMDEIRVDDKLNFVERPVEIVDRKIRKLKKTKYTLVKVRWNSRRGPEYTWEREENVRAKYPQLFDGSSVSSS